MEKLSPVDFLTVESTTIQYSKHEFKFLPIGKGIEFESKDYAPKVFRQIRELDGIDYAEYRTAAFGQETLHQIASPRGPSSSYFPSNDRFVIKLLRKCDMKVILGMLPKYCDHMKKHAASLLVRYYGMHVIKPAGGPKVCFVVLSNLFRGNFCIDRLFDLKGSSQGRTISKPDTQERIILKDSDLDFSFYLDPLILHRLLAQIKYDCEFLESEGIMGYSVLLGVHIASSPEGDWRNSGTASSSASSNSLQTCENVELTFSNICDPYNGPGFKFGVQMPARALLIRRKNGEHSRRREEMTREWFDVILCFGVVDIHHNYNVIKRIEHAYKSLQYSPKSISAVNPRAYSRRFQDFLGMVFQTYDTDS